MFKAILNGISRVENAAIAALFAFNLVILFVTVVMRYVFNNSPCWPEEASRYVMIWIIYLGVSQSVEKRSEIKIDILTKLIPSQALEKVLGIFALCAGLVVSVFISIYGIRFAAVLAETDQTAASFTMPMALAYAVIPASGFLMALKYIAALSSRIGELSQGRRGLGSP